MIILGVDPGIADTGYGVIETTKNNSLRCITYGSIQTSSKLKLEDRLNILNEELKKIIQEYKPSLSCVEELFFYNNAKTAFIVGQARGVIILTINQENIPIKEATPLQVKQAVATYGQATKAQVQKMVQLILNLKTIPKPDDAADGLALAIYASNNKTIT